MLQLAPGSENGPNVDLLSNDAQLGTANFLTAGDSEPASKIKLLITAAVHHKTATVT